MGCGFVNGCRIFTFAIDYCSDFSLEALNSNSGTVIIKKIPQRGILSYLYSSCLPACGWLQQFKELIKLW